jgi:hypothetical protein
VPSRPISEAMNQEFFSSPPRTRALGPIYVGGTVDAWIWSDTGSGTWAATFKSVAITTQSYTLATLQAAVLTALQSMSANVNCDLVFSDGRISFVQQRAGAGTKTVINLISTACTAALGFAGHYSPAGISTPANYDSPAGSQYTTIAATAPYTVFLNIASLPATIVVPVESAGKFTAGTDRWVYLEGRLSRRGRRYSDEGHSSEPEHEAPSVAGNLTAVDTGANTLTIELGREPYSPALYTRWNYVNLRGTTAPGEGLEVRQIFVVRQRVDQCFVGTDASGTGGFLDVTIPPDQAPLLNLSDFDTASMAVIGAADPLRARFYGIEEGANFAEIMAEELKTMGAALVTRSGKLGWAYIRRPYKGGTSIASIDSSRALALGLPAYHLSSEAIVNQITAKLNYDIIARDFTDDVLNIDQTTSQQRYRVRRKIKIENRGLMYDQFSSTMRDVLLESGLRLFDVFGSIRPTVEIECTFRGFGVELGDLVTLTNFAIPNVSTGDRGVSSVLATVLGRRFEYATGKARLSLMLDTGNAGGYAPCARVTAWDNATKIATFTANKYAASGVEDISKFNVGDKVEFIQLDSLTPTIISNEIASINAGAHQATMTTAMGGLPSPSTNTINMRFDDYDTAGLLSAQKNWAWVGDETDMFLGASSDPIYRWIA